MRPPPPPHDPDCCGLTYEGSCAGCRTLFGKSTPDNCSWELWADGLRDRLGLDRRPQRLKREELKAILTPMADLIESCRRDPALCSDVTGLLRELFELPGAARGGGR